MSLWSRLRGFVVCRDAGRRPERIRMLDDIRELMNQMNHPKIRERQHDMENDDVQIRCSDRGSRRVRAACRNGGRDRRLLTPYPYDGLRLDAMTHLARRLPSRGRTCYPRTREVSTASEYRE
jgi:hypothetical protein